MSYKFVLYYAKIKIQNRIASRVNKGTSRNRGGYLI